jgi:hypothetical protein
MKQDSTQVDKLPKKSLVTSILSTLPPVSFAFSYGSAVTPQLGYNTTKPHDTLHDIVSNSPLSAAAVQLDEHEKMRKSISKPPMLDMIFAVEDSTSWHAKNLRLNRNHYSFPWQFLGEGLINSVQCKTGAGIWYNTLVPIPNSKNGATMKYGVISVDILLDDLLNWRYLYAAGRLHKPVCIAQPVIGVQDDFIKKTRNTSKFSEGERRDEILIASRENLRHALRAALLMLPSEFSAEDLYTTITAISYNGDWRMVFGENPHKVSNIVSAQISLFHSLYGPILNASFPSVSVSASNEYSTISSQILLTTDLSVNVVRSLRFKQDTSFEARLTLGLSLPIRLQKKMAEAQRRHLDEEEKKRKTLRSSISYFVTGLSNSPTRISQHIIQDISKTTISSSLSPRKRIALILAEEGRALLSRLQQQRLQILITNKERWVNRMRTVFQLPETSEKIHDQKNLMQNVSFRSISSSVDLQQALYTAKLLSESDGTSPHHFESAISTQKVLSFWDALIHDATNTKAALSLHEDIGKTSSRFLRPAIAHIVGSHARTQSIKGIVTAGPYKASLYVLEKLQKFFRAIVK